MVVLLVDCSVLCCSVLLTASQFGLCFVSYRYKRYRVSSWYMKGNFHFVIAHLLATKQKSRAVSMCLLKPKYIYIEKRMEEELCERRKFIMKKLFISFFFLCFSTHIIILIWSSSATGCFHVLLRVSGKIAHSLLTVCSQLPLTSFPLIYVLH